MEETIGLNGVTADGRVEEVEGLVGVITSACFLESFALDLVTGVKQHPSHNCQMSLE